MTRQILLWLALLAVLAIASSTAGAAYMIVDAQCRTRGGHIEVVYGRGGGWMCDGATRP